MFSKWVALAASIPFIALLVLSGTRHNIPYSNRVEIPTTIDDMRARLRVVAASAKGLLRQQRLNEDYIFYINMRIPSGKRRFYIYNIAADSVEGAGLVTHGIGSGYGGPEFSNVPRSNCTSLGNYKIGASYYGEFGLAYRLHGLDSSNCNAYRRCVVLHALDCVPDREVYPAGICTSLGCPMVSPTFLENLTGYMEESSKPILLRIVYE